MPAALLLAGVVILVGVVLVAMGRGGEMAEFPSDRVPPQLDGLLTAADVAMLRPPWALWGYNMRVTDAALSRIAELVTERDMQIALLRRQLAELGAAPGHGPPDHGVPGAQAALGEEAEPAAEGHEVAGDAGQDTRQGAGWPAEGAVASRDD